MSSLWEDGLGQVIMFGTRIIGTLEIEAALVSHPLIDSVQIVQIDSLQTMICIFVICICVMVSCTGS